MAGREPAVPAFVPRFPALLATALLGVWLLVLCLPMFSGGFLVNPASDQMWTGVPFRWFGAEEWRRTGSVALWNPYIFGGLPFVGAMHGDILYPTAWLRLLLPVDAAMNLGFAVHFLLAGLFTYLLLRALGFTWTGSVAGGLAYELAGVLASLVRPGHDGKLFVSALMPLILLALVVAIRERRREGYGLLALGVGLGILGPHIQMMQYTLVFAGLFTLYLAFWADGRPGTPLARWSAVGLALAAVVLGFGVGMAQLWPFIDYLPHAARYAGAQGWEYATAYAMPPAHLVDWLVPDFTGSLGRYWGENPLKLHTEYLGSATLVLASVGVAHRGHRRLLLFLGGIFLLFVLVALGGHTPFYRLWYALVPGVKVTRAPGMAFFIPTFVVAVSAAAGVERLERGEGKRLLPVWLAASGALLLLAVGGGLGALAQNLAAPEKREIARQASEVIAASGTKSAIVLAIAAGLAWLAASGRLRGALLAAGLVAVVGADLYANARQYWEYSPPAAELYADDPVTEHLAATPVPYRALDPGLYPTAFLMAKRVPNVLGHHGNELHSYDQLLGGKNTWSNLFPDGRVTLADFANPRNPVLWDLLAVRFVILPAAGLPLPGWRQVAGPATAPGGQSAYLYERDEPPDYARVIPAGAKLPEDRILPTLLDPRLDARRVVLLPEDAEIDVPRLDSLPEAGPSRARVTSWEPGRMTVRLEPSPERPAFLLVAENWYPDWRASVDGASAAVLRGDGSLITVPLPAGAARVELSVRSDSFRRGRATSLASLALILAWIVLPIALRRRSA